MKIHIQGLSEPSNLSITAYTSRLQAFQTTLATFESSGLQAESSALDQSIQHVISAVGCHFQCFSKYIVITCAQRSLVGVSMLLAQPSCIAVMRPDLALLHVSFHLAAAPHGSCQCSLQ